MVELVETKTEHGVLVEWWRRPRGAGSSTARSWRPTRHAEKLARQVVEQDRSERTVEDHVRRRATAWATRYCAIAQPRAGRVVSGPSRRRCATSSGADQGMCAQPPSSVTDPPTRLRPRKARSTVVWPATRLARAQAHDSRLPLEPARRLPDGGPGRHAGDVPPALGHRGGGHDRRTGAVAARPRRSSAMVARGGRLHCQRERRHRRAWYRRGRARRFCCGEVRTARATATRRRFSHRAGGRHLGARRSRPGCGADRAGAARVHLRARWWRRRGVRQAQPGRADCSRRSGTP